MNDPGSECLGLVEDVDGMIWKKDNARGEIVYRMVVPESMKKEILRCHHDCVLARHGGYSKN